MGLPIPDSLKPAFSDVFCFIFRFLHFILLAHSPPRDTWKSRSTHILCDPIVLGLDDPLQRKLHARRGSGKKDLHFSAPCSLLSLCFLSFFLTN